MSQFNQNPHNQMYQQQKHTLLEQNGIPPQWNNHQGPPQMQGMNVLTTNGLASSTPHSSRDSSPMTRQTEVPPPNATSTPNKGPTPQTNHVPTLHAKRYPTQNYTNYPQQGFYQQKPQMQPQMQQPQPQTMVQQQQQNINYINSNQLQQQPMQHQQNINYTNSPQQQYPPQQQTYQQNYHNLPQQMQNMNIVQSGFNKMWGSDYLDLLQYPNVLPEKEVEPPNVTLGPQFSEGVNCSSEIFRCTLTKVPESNSLLQKCRLPFGVLIHPFKDLSQLPVIQCNTIVRCRACRTYINPFVIFADSKKWKCNLCYRINELPEEFQYDPLTKSYGDPSRRPEVRSSTIEYIAPSEYMLRPPQPAVYLFLLDISRPAVESGYLHTVCNVLLEQLQSLPGDARTQLGFLAYDSALHFYALTDGLSQPREMIVTDIDDVFLPCPDTLLTNLKEHSDLIIDLLNQLPTRYANSYDSSSALGPALQAAFKLMSPTGGRVTVFQAILPQLGPGALVPREDPNQRAAVKDIQGLNPATDFYKRLALDCSGQQIAVDLFLVNSQYIDVATISGISRFSGGCMHHFPLYSSNHKQKSGALERCFRRYLTRKIGFEAVMRIRCTRGLSIHTFHGNFFVRSTDLLSLPNVNPDAGFGMQVTIEETLANTICFQAALLYTSSRGERRIRVHTLCLPVVTTVPEVLNAADQQCIMGILAKMAVDRSLQSSLTDARDAFINVAIDVLSCFKASLNMGQSQSGLLVPFTLKLLPLYILALLKSMAFRTGQSTRLDDRVFAMCEMKTLPLPQLLQTVYPDLYPIYHLSDCPTTTTSDGTIVPKPRRLQLTARNIDMHGAYLLDTPHQIIVFVCPNVSSSFLIHTLATPSYAALASELHELPKNDAPDNELLHSFINHLNDEKPYAASILILKENSTQRHLFMERLIEDRFESALSYNEFLQHLKAHVK